MMSATVLFASHGSLWPKPFIVELICEGEVMREVFTRFWSEDSGQDIAEYAVMLAVILVIVVGTIRLIGSNANTVFSNAASSIQ
jgi:Flp pilus assembly pilin Flp